MSWMSVEAAAAALIAGRTVAFPTETVYGLGGDARNAEAVQAIFNAKGRPSDNPLIVHVESMEAAIAIAMELNVIELELMQRFWPGALTIVLPVRRGVLAAEVTAGLDTVGIRVPSHPVALELLRTCKLPIAAPSANRSGKPSPTTAQHVQDDLGARIAGVIDGGACDVGLESTVVRVVNGKIHILRPGGVTIEQLLAHGYEAIYVRELEDSASVPRSPGVKYTHYAPQAEMEVWIGQHGFNIGLAELLKNECMAFQGDGQRIACLLFQDTFQTVGELKNVRMFSLGDRNQPENAAHDLYAFLRTCDQEGITRIIAEGCTEEGAGLAFMNRLLKASGHRMRLV